MSSEFIIREQQEKIDKYEKKLKALIHAYKSLLVEKTALEQTVNALSHEENAASFPGKISKLDHNYGKTVSNQTENEAAPQMEKGITENVSVQGSSTDNVLTESTEKVFPAGDKLTTLKKALAAISTEKNRQETAFTEDRKRLIEENEKICEKLQNHIAENEKLKAAYEDSLTQLQKHCEEIKSQRESEKAKHLTDYEDLTLKVAEERSINDSLQQLLLQRDTDILKLKEKLDAQSSELFDKAYVEQISSELRDIKMQKNRDLEVERTNVETLQKELSGFRQKHEASIECLERKLVDMTSLVSSSQRDNISLKDQLDQARLKINELESGTLQNASNIRVDNVTHDETDIKRKFKLVVDALLPEYDITSSIFDSPKKLKNVAHKKCNATLKSLADEYSQYRDTNQNSGINSKECGDMVNLRREVEKFKSELQVAQAQIEFERSSYESRVTDLTNLCSSLKDDHNRNKSTLENAYQNKLTEMENEIMKQRERMSQLLLEKDQELDAFRRIYSSNYASASNPSAPVNDSNNGNKSLATRSESRLSYNSIEEAYNGSEDVMQSIFAPADPLPSSALSHYYSKELYRRDSDIQRLRSDLRRLENQLVSVQHELISKELTHHEIVEKLKEEIRFGESKLARQREIHSSSTTDSTISTCSWNDNVEYVKNVFVQFACSKESKAKLSMLKALCLALKFTSKELTETIKCYAENNGIKQ